MMFIVTCLLVLFTLTSSQSSNAVATFGSSANNDSVIGTVTVEDGEVSIDIDVMYGAMNYPATFTETCLAAGFSYHIHVRYENLPNAWAFNSSNCGATNTGGHYDPWLACGGASGNSLCESKGGCVDDAVYDCDTTNFDEDPLVCEIGDWSGKYGTIKSDDISTNYTFTGSYSSFYEISATDLTSMSVVFHCGDTGARAFCAEFVVTDNSAETKPDQEDMRTVWVDFSDAISETKDYDEDSTNTLTMNDDGTYDFQLSISTKNNLDSEYDSCATDGFSYYIFSEWNSVEDSLWGDDCLSATGNVTWDPTASCLPFSGNAACESGGTCGTNAYSCSTSSPYSCAPGDLSGRWGTVDSDGTVNIDGTVPDYYGPSLANIAGLSVGVVCGNEILMCGRIQDVSEASAVATFSNSDYTNVSGTVTVTNQYIDVDLDLSNQVIDSTCSDGGMGWHIHEMWGYSDNQARHGATACSGTYTGGHYDPYAGCGPATGNTYCESAEDGTCDADGDYIKSSTWDADAGGNYTCSSSVFPTLPFACEVGDWSGKYGSATLASNAISGTYQSQYAEVRATDLEGRSIVYHCNGGSRIFCAPFIVTGSDGPDNIPSVVSALDEDDLESYTAYFNNIFDTKDYQNYIRFYSNGKYEIVMSIDSSSDECTNSDSYRISLYNDWGSSSSKQLSGDKCTSNIGTFFDPGYSCPAQVDNDQCTCKSADGYTYSCDYETEKFSCAAGDISGKFGWVTPGTDFYAVGYDFTLPELNDLADLAVVIECGEDDSFSPIGCTGFSDDDSSAYGFYKNTFGIFVFTILAVLFFC